MSALYQRRVREASGAPGGLDHPRYATDARAGRRSALIRSSLCRRSGRPGLVFGAARHQHCKVVFTGTAPGTGTARPRNAVQVADATLEQAFELPQRGPAAAADHIFLWIGHDMGHRAAGWRERRFRLAQADSGSPQSALRGAHSARGFFASQTPRLTTRAIARLGFLPDTVRYDTQRTYPPVTQRRRAHADITARIAPRRLITAHSRPKRQRRARRDGGARACLSMARTMTRP